MDSDNDPNNLGRRRSDRTGAREIVSFRLAGQDFCIDIMNIREIRSWSPPTSLPHAPAYVRGLINLRGAVLPIIDLADRLGLPSGEATERNVIIVAIVDAQVVGLVVDGVSDILTVREEHLQPTPAFGTDASEACVQGIVAIDSRMIRLLDLRRVFPGSIGAAA